MQKDKTQIIKDSIDSLMEMFKSGDFPEKIALSIIRRHEGDTIPADDWSLGNRTLMLAQGTTDARGYKQWMEVNRFVKKGSRAIYILAPLTRKIRETDKATGEEKDTVIITGFRPIPVFPVEATDGEPLPNFDYVPKTFPRFFDVAEKLNIKVEYRPMIGNYYGKFSARGNQIQLCSQDAVVYYHELSHAVHNTFVDLRVYDPDKAEVVAEFSAVVLCALSDIHGYEDQAYMYIRHYCRKDEQKPEGVMKKIMGVLSDVEKIVSIVLDATSDELPAKEAV
ncbi:MAG TPA: hypothetical protein DEP57_08635 [Selenomonas sp.]|nr:hypothetical protein [Selenomonas sp.]